MLNPEIPAKVSDYFTFLAELEARITLRADGGRGAGTRRTIRAIG
jgi:hypothetical protein